MEIMRAEQVNYRYYGRISALSDVSITIEEGGIHAVIGSNGSGKSTLLQVLGGLVYPEGGCVIFRGEEVTENSLKERNFLKFFRSRVGYVFQDSDIQLFCPTVRDELLYAPMQLGLGRHEALTRAEEILDMLSISHLAERPTYMLSGGEKKRVAIASVLTMNPEVLLLDEPTNGLDPKTQCFLVELMLALNTAGKSIVIATHDLALVSELRAKVSVLSEDHRLVAEDSADRILSDEQLLLTVNLVHEHIHCHDGMEHRHIHSHYLFHKH